MRKRLPTRLLSVLLVVALLTGLVAPVQAVSPKSDITFTQVDNSAVSVNPLQRDDEKLNSMRPPARPSWIRPPVPSTWPTTTAHWAGRTPV